MRIEGYAEATVDLRYPIKIDGEGFTKIIVREFGGRDEEAIGKDKESVEDATYATIFAIQRLIAEVPGSKRLPNIEEVGYLPYGEIERIGVILRELTLGEKFKAMGACPHCNKPVEYEVVSSEFIVNELPEYKDSQVDLKRGAIRAGKHLKTATLIPFSGFSMIELQKLSKSDIDNGFSNSDFLATMVEKFDDIVATEDDVKDLTKVDRLTLRDAIKIPNIVKPVLGYVCSHCEKDIDLKVWVFDFLY